MSETLCYFLFTALRRHLWSISAYQKYQPWATAGVSETRWRPTCKVPFDFFKDSFPSCSKFKVFLAVDQSQTTRLQEVPPPQSWVNFSVQQLQIQSNQRINTDQINTPARSAQRHSDGDGIWACWSPFVILSLIALLYRLFSLLFCCLASFIVLRQKKIIRYPTWGSMSNMSRQVLIRPLIVTCWALPFNLQTAVKLLGILLLHVHSSCLNCLLRLDSWS